jgi:very-short-patch-repair endonuclease
LSPVTWWISSGPCREFASKTDSWSHHRDRPTFEKDRQTDVDLVAAGYEVHRATYRMLERNPGPFLKNVRHALRTRTASNFRAGRQEI